MTLTLFFDVDGTLMDQPAAEHAAAEALHRAVPNAAVRTLDDFRAEWHKAQQHQFARYLAGEMSFREQRRERLRQVLGGGLPEEEADTLFDVYLRAYEASWRLYPDVLPCLDSLSGATLGITNGDAEQQRRKLAHMGLARRFRHVLISGEVGLCKPDPEIFHEACAQARSPPARTRYVGDQLYADAVAAAEAGLVGVWLNRTAAPPNLEGVHEIGSLAELPADGGRGRLWSLIRTYRAPSRSPAIAIRPPTAPERPVDRGPGHSTPG